MADYDEARLLDRLDDVDRSLGEQAIQAIRAAITEGRLVPGVLYSVYKIASDLNISRSPVRDALLRLAEANLVQFVKNRGFRVLRPSPRDIAEFFSVRLLIEPTAAAKVAYSLDANGREELQEILHAMHQELQRNDEDRFLFHDQRLHMAIMGFARNRYAASVVSNIRDVSRMLGVSTIENRRDLVDVYQEHASIVEAIIGRNPEKASELMDTHLRSTGRLLLTKSGAQASIEDLLECWPANTIRYDRM